MSVGEGFDLLKILDFESKMHKIVNFEPDGLKTFMHDIVSSILARKSLP